ncbi:uncharacterized protein LOC143242963 [Tachypleus tridentatus]|uniref:uncharacterized protein LOC143242963 n=1 Tax=Tachypleus tridentatus TaxID=6853 RepID=UPI003FD4AE32
MTLSFPGYAVPFPPTVPPIIVDGLPPHLSPLQVATFIAQAKPGASIDPSRTRILRRGGILLQPSTPDDLSYLCSPWNSPMNISCAPTKSPTSLFTVFLKGIHQSIQPSEIKCAVETQTQSVLYAVHRIYSKSSRQATKFMKIVTPSKRIADTILRNGCYYHIFHFSAERPRRHPTQSKIPKQPASVPQPSGSSSMPTATPPPVNQSSEKYTQTEFLNKTSQGTQTIDEVTKTSESSTMTDNIPTAEAVSQTKTIMINQNTQYPDDRRITRASRKAAFLNSKLSPFPNRSQWLEEPLVPSNSDNSCCSVVKSPFIENIPWLDRLSDDSTD